MKLPERNRWGRLPGYPINPWVAKLRRSFRRFLRARDAEAQQSWGKGGGAARHNVTEKKERSE